MLKRVTSGVGILLASLVAGGQTHDPSVTALGRGFEAATTRVDGAEVFYVRGGSGPAVILLHGFPEDWWEWRKVLVPLSETFTVIAVDLRGVGPSASAAEDYTTTALAGDIHNLVQDLKLQRVYIAGHDIGGMVAYAYARLYPQDLRGIMILDVPLPGLDPWEKVSADPRLWHFHFHQTANIPEALVAGRQRIYFRSFFDRFMLNKEAVTAADLDHFAQSYEKPEQLRAGFGYYRSFPADAAFNAAHRERLDVPITLAGGDQSGGRTNPLVAEALRKQGCTNVATELIGDSGHFSVDEQPATVASLIQRYASR